MKQLQNESGRALVLAIGVIVLMLVLTTTVLLAANTGTKNTEHRESSMKSVKNAELGLEQLRINLEEEANELMYEKTKGAIEKDHSRLPILNKNEFGNELEEIIKKYKVKNNGNESLIQKEDEKGLVYRAFVKDINKVTDNEGRRLVTLVSYGKEKGVIKKIETEIEVGMVNYPSMFNYVLSTNYRGASKQDRENAINDIQNKDLVQPGINYAKTPTEEMLFKRQGNAYLLGGPDIMGNVRIANSLMYNPYSFHFTYANPAEWGGGNLIYGGNPHWWNSGESFQGLLGYKSYRYYYQRDGKKFEKDNIKKEDAFIKANEIEGMASDQKGLLKYTRDKYSYRALLESNKLLDKTINQQRFIEQSPNDIFETNSMYTKLIKNGQLLKETTDYENDEKIPAKDINKGIFDAVPTHPVYLNESENFSFYRPKLDLFNPAAYYDGEKAYYTQSPKSLLPDKTCIEKGSARQGSTSNLTNCSHKNSRKNFDLVQFDDGSYDIQNNGNNADKPFDASKINLTPKNSSKEEIKQTVKELQKMAESIQEKIDENPDSTEVIAADKLIKDLKSGSKQSVTAQYTELDRAIDLYELIYFKNNMKVIQEEVEKALPDFNNMLNQYVEDLRNYRKNDASFWDLLGLWIKENKLKRIEIKPNFNGKRTFKDIDEWVTSEFNKYSKNIQEEAKDAVNKMKENSPFIYTDKRYYFSNKLLKDQLNNIVLAPYSSDSGEKNEDDQASNETKTLNLNMKNQDLVFGWNTRLARKIVNANTYKNGTINFNRAFFRAPYYVPGIDIDGSDTTATDKYPQRRLIIGYPNLAQVHNNITLNGALFVDGDVRIRKATLNGRFLMYVDGDVEIDHSHFGYPNGHKADGQIYNKDDAMFIFATGNVKIKNISHHRDKPSVFRGFIYAGGDLEIHGGDTNLNIIGGISGRDVFLSSLRGPNYPTIKINGEKKGVTNNGVESFLAPEFQNKHIGRVRLIHDEKIGEDYMKLMSTYGINDRNIFEVESVPTGERDLSTIGSYEDMLEDIKKSTKK